MRERKRIPTEIEKINILSEILQEQDGIESLQLQTIHQIILKFKSRYNRSGSIAFFLRYINDALKCLGSKNRISYSCFYGWILKPVSGMIYNMILRAFTMIYQEMNSETLLKDVTVLNASNMLIGDTNWRWLVLKFQNSSEIFKKRTIYLNLSGNSLSLFVLREVLNVFIDEKANIYVNLTDNGRLLNDLNSCNDIFDRLSSSSLIYFPSEDVTHSPIVINNEVSLNYKTFLEIRGQVEKTHPSYFLKPDLTLKRSLLDLEMGNLEHLPLLILSLIEGDCCKRNLFHAWKLCTKLDQDDVKEISDCLQVISDEEDKTDVDEEREYQENQIDLEIDGIIEQ
jgi:hypothetical protein